MNIEKVKNLVSLVEGRGVTFKTLAANSLMLHFNGPPGSPDLWTLWLEPHWRYEESGKIIVGSDDLCIPDDTMTDDEYNVFLEEFCGRTDSLQGAIVQRIIIDETTRDLCITLSGNKSVRTFTCGKDDEIWRFISDSCRIVIFPTEIMGEEWKRPN